MFKCDGCNIVFDDISDNWLCDKCEIKENQTMNRQQLREFILHLWNIKPSEFKVIFKNSYTDSDHLLGEFERYNCPIKFMAYLDTHNLDLLFRYLKDKGE